MATIIHQRIADSGNIGLAKFSPTCGNWLYHYDPKQPNRLKLKASTLQETTIIQPTVHIWTSEKQQWYQTPERVETFLGQP